MIALFSLGALSFAQSQNAATTAPVTPASPAASATLALTGPTPSSTTQPTPPATPATSAPSAPSTAPALPPPPITRDAYWHCEVKTKSGSLFKYNAPQRADADRGAREACEKMHKWEECHEESKCTLRVPKDVWECGTGSTDGRVYKWRSGTPLEATIESRRTCAKFSGRSTCTVPPECLQLEKGWPEQFTVYFCNVPTAKGEDYGWRAPTRKEAEDQARDSCVKYRNKETCEAEAECTPSQGG